MADDDLTAVLEEVFRLEWPALVGAAARITGDLTRAEEIAQDVLVSALDRWPFTGVPDRPGAWLMTAARNRARNARRDEARAQARERAVAWPEGPEHDEDLEEPIGDDRLRLVFICCHPVLNEEAQVALTLRMVGGLSTAEIARAFVVPVATMAQRLVRAKRTVAEAAVPFAMPEPQDWHGRLPGVLSVVYLIFNEGYSAAFGDELTRPRLCAEALRLASLLAELVPHEAEVQGLLALLRLHAARVCTRADAQGELVLLQDQDRSRWDRALIDAGRGAIEHALRLGPPGSMTLQAMIALYHAEAPSWAATDWEAIVVLYDELATVNRSPVVSLNRAVAVSMRRPDLGLSLIETVEEDLANYTPLWAARADVLRRLGRLADAGVCYRRAAELGTNEPERRFLMRRAEECERPADRGVAG